jgi:hypothetical protein
MVLLEGATPRPAPGCEPPTVTMAFRPWTGKPPHSGCTHPLAAIMQQRAGMTNP